MRIPLNELKLPAIILVNHTLSKAENGQSQLVRSGLIFCSLWFWVPYNNIFYENPIADF